MIKKHIFIKTVSFLSVFILTLCGFLIKEKSRSDYYNKLLESQYSRAFEQLNSSLNNISTTVEKTVYVSSAKRMTSLSTEIFSEAEMAKSALSELPTGNSGLSTIYRFLSQVGNYALSVAKGITNENSVNEKQRAELKLLSSTAKTISEVINDVGVEYNTHTQWAETVENRLKDVISDEGFAASLTELEENLTDYPTLIYDGPYSDHILQKMPLMTANAREYSKSEALAVAKSFVGEDCLLKFDDMQGGKIESYRFSGSNVTVAVSKNGGYVTFMRKNRTVDEERLSYEQALLKAEKYLENMQIRSLTDTYYYTDEGVCVINFAHLDGQTVCYTDLIKVGVAMDTGEIVLLETVGYLTNHTDRAFLIPAFTAEQAAEKLSSDLEIQKSLLALIPTDAGGEVRCYEFLCTGEAEREILVYINVQTLEEEQIYILLKTDVGTLVK